MPDWLRLDRGKLNTEKIRRVRGVEINVVLSPYDVPRAVRGFYDAELDRFVIEFEYLGDEKWTRQSQDEYIELRIGRKSERLMGVEVNVQAMKAEAVGLRMHVQHAVSSALQRLSHEREGQRGAGSYEVAQDAVDFSKDELFEEIVDG